MERTILVTGANGNLGQEVVRVLSADGNTILATVGSEELPDAIKLKTVEYDKVDLLDESATEAYVTRIIEAYPQVDVAVLLVGGFVSGDIDSTDVAKLDKQIALNFKSAWNVVRPLMSHFKKQGRGQFILIGSRPAIRPEDGKNMVAYAISKSMLFTLAEIINAEGSKMGITASMIVPSTLDTPSNRQSMPDADPEKWVKTTDIAEAIRFILSDAGRKLRQPVFKVYHRS